MLCFRPAWLACWPKAYQCSHRTSHIFQDIRDFSWLSTFTTQSGGYHWRAVCCKEKAYSGGVHSRSIIGAAMGTEGARLAKRLGWEGRALGQSRDIEAQLFYQHRVVRCCLAAGGNNNNNDKKCITKIHQEGNSFNRPKVHERCILK